MSSKQSGRIILKSVPTNIAAKQVAGYLNKLAGNHTEEQIIRKIRQTPTVLFKKVSAETGEKIAKDLIKLGAVAGFEPFDASSGQTTASQIEAPAKVIAQPDIHSENPNDASEGSIHSLGSRIPRWSTIAFALVLLGMLLFIFMPTRSPDETSTTLNNKDQSHQPAAAQQVNKRNHQHLQQNAAAGASLAAEKTEAGAAKPVTRVGVYIFSAQIPGLGDSDYAKAMSKSVADALKTDPRLEYVDRVKIDQIVKKESLTVKQLFDPKEAARVGRQVGIDVIIVGQLIYKNKIDNQYAEKSIAVKAIRTDPALTVDIGCIQQGKYTRYDKYLQALARFVQEASMSTASLSQRNFLVLGEFVDHSPKKKLPNHHDRLNSPFGPSKKFERQLHYRLPSQSQKLQGYLINEFENRRHVCIVSQSHLKYLFAVFNLDEHGHCRDKGNETSAQPVYTIINGNFTIKPGEDEVTPFEIKLQFEFLGQAKQRMAIAGKTWDDGLKKLRTEIDYLLRAQGDLAKLERVRDEKRRLCEEQGPICEARAHFERGKALSGIAYGSWPYLNVSRWADGQGFSVDDLSSRVKNKDGKWQKLSKEREIINIRKAIDAFESALFLDPDNYETNLFLAVCLSHPAIGEKRRSDDLLQQIVSNSADDRLKFIAAKALGITESVTYAPSFKKRVFTPEYYAQTYAANIISLLYRDDSLVAWWEYGDAEMASVLTQIKKSIFAQCNNVKWQNEHGGNVAQALNGAAAEISSLRYPSTRNNKIETYFREVISTIREKYPRQLPFLMARNYPATYPLVMEELLRTMKQIEAGEIEPLAENAFLDELYSTLRSCADADTGDLTPYEVKKIFAGGVQIGDFLEKRKYKHMSSFKKVQHAYCYKGIGELEKALSLLEQVENGNTPSMKKAFVEHKFTSFWQILNTDPDKEAKKQTVPKARRTIRSEVTVPKNRFIQALALDGDTLWICSNKTQVPLAPTGVYDPLIYSYRAGMAEPQPLNLPVKLKGMATSIVAKNHTLWIGTDEGLLEVIPKKNVFRHFKEDNGLLKPNVNSLSLQGNKLYVGLGSGIGYLDTINGRFTGLVTTNDVVRVAACPEGLWAVTHEGHLQFYDEKTGKKNFQSAWTCANAYSLTVSPKYVVIGRNLQVGRYFGMRNVGSSEFVLYDRKLDKSRRIDPLFPGIDILSLAFVHDLLWIGGRGFLAVVDFSENKVLDQLSGRDAEFYAMLPDNQGGIWVSQGYKLYHLGYGSNGFEKR